MLERAQELEKIRLELQRVLAQREMQPENPRALLFATNDEGTRRFVEVCVNAA